MMIDYFIYFIQSIILLLLTPFFIGLLKRIKAIIRGYKGPSILQPYYDLAKLFNKGRVISTDSSFITKIAPILSLTAAITTAFFIPVFYTGKSFYLGNLFIVLFLLGNLKFFSVLLGLDCGSTFGGMGSSRELFISMMAEPIMFLMVTFLFMETKTFNIFRITSLNSLNNWYSAAHIIAAIAFVILLVGENSRMPVDNPETHLELTMIHEAMILDISGKDLACIELSSYIKLIIFITIFINCFFPIGIGTVISVGSLIISFLIYILKVIACLIIISLIETTMAKLRLFRAPEIFAWAFSISIVAIAVNIISH